VHGSENSTVGAIAKEHEFSLPPRSYCRNGTWRVLLSASRRPAHFQNLTITQITTSGNAALIAISPNGKYILNVKNENGPQSLMVAEHRHEQRHASYSSGSDERALQIGSITSFPPLLSWPPDGKLIPYSGGTGFSSAILPVRHVTAVEAN